MTTLGCGYYRSVNPHVYIAEHYKDEFEVEVNYELPKSNLEEYLRQFDIVHIHKQLDKDCKIAELIKFLGAKLIVDVDDYYLLGNDHPMSLSAKKERWHEPIVNHIKLADMVSTTTDIYASVLKKHNDYVRVFPNAIDPTESQFIQTKSQNSRLRIGLICGSSHLKDIELIANLPSQINTATTQIVMCGFDTRGTRTIYHQDTRTSRT